MQSIKDQNFQMEEMVEFLIRMVGKSNEKLTEMDQKIKQLEKELKGTKNIKVS